MKTGSRLLLVAALAAGLPIHLGCHGRGDGASADATAGDGKDGGNEKDKAGAKDGKTGAEETAVPVEVATLARGRIESILRLSTNLTAEAEVEVHAQAARLVRKLHVEEGSPVKAGQVLLLLQDDEQQSALLKAESLHDKAERERVQLERLREKELVSEQTYSDAVFEFEQRRIALGDARREAGYTVVRAPIAGIITRRLVNVGDLVTVGQHLFDLVDFDSLVAPIYVPEKDLPRLRPGQSAVIRAQAARGGETTGRVERIAPVVDPKSGTVKVTVALTGASQLQPGMYVDVTLLTDVHEDAILVPKRALVYDREQTFVFRLKEGRRVERVSIEPVLADEGSIEPRGGFAAGDQVVVAGQAGLKDGALVRLPGDPEPAKDKADKGDVDRKEETGKDGKKKGNGNT